MGDGDNDGGFGGDDGGGFGGGFGDGGFGVGGIGDSSNDGYGSIGSEGWGTTDVGFAGTEGIGSASSGFGSDSGFSVSPDAFGYSFQDAMEGFSPSIDGWGLASFGAPAESLGFSPSFVDSNMSLADAFNTSPNEEDGFGKFAKNMFSFISNPIVSTIGKMADKSGMFGPAMNIAGLAAKGAKGDNAAVGKGFGSTFGGMLGSVAGPVGAMAGAALGGYAGQSLGGVTANQGMAGVPGQGTDGLGGGNMYGDIAGGLAGLYMGNRAKGQYNQALNGLNDIYSPNGVYAQQLRQQMERRDAASGRRSQYGPREAQLMAALADSQARTMSSPGYANLMQQRGIAQNQGLNTILALMAKNPGVMSRAGRYIGDGIGAVMNGGGLESLFNGGYSNAWDMPADSGPQLPDSFLGDNWWGGGEGYFGE